MPKWAYKIAAKLVLGRIPFRHSLLKKFGMFRHGSMENVDYALGVFQKHMNWAYPDGMPENFVVLELGPGDSLVSALIAKSYGAAEIYHVDVGAYASKNVALYKKCAEQIQEQGLPTIDLSGAKTIGDVKEICSAVYLTEGLKSLKQLPSNYFDFIWSHSVVEHIRKKDFGNFMLELCRIIKPEGKISHSVDLEDHLEHKLNSLRFSDKFWENNIVANSGFYTNRLRYSQSIEIMKKSGFSILESESKKWEQIPTPKKKLHKSFRNLNDNELKTKYYRVLLKRAS